jgi:hypothetical protein
MHASLSASMLILEPLGLGRVCKARAIRGYKRW